MVDTAQRRALAAHFGTLAAVPSFETPDVHVLFLCFTNRCGSDFLSQAMASTGLLPGCEEPFNPATVIARSRARGLTSIQAYVTDTIATLARNTWFCSKISIEQLVMLCETGILRSLWPRSHFILLERNDKLGQAISRAIAWQTERWTSHQTARKSAEDIVYDRDRITDGIARVTWETNAFRAFFVANQRVPIHRSYEALRADLGGTVSGIFDSLGIAGAQADPSRITLAPVSGPINAEWRRRYLAGA